MDVYRLLDSERIHTPNGLEGRASDRARCEYDEDAVFAACPCKLPYFLVEGSQTLFIENCTEKRKYGEKEYTPSEAKEVYFKLIENGFFAKGGYYEG